MVVLLDCDPHGHGACLATCRPRETQRSTVKYNDSGPRWLETFDFVMVSAGSILNVVVKDKTGILDATLSLSLSKVSGVMFCVLSCLARSAVHARLCSSCLHKAARLLLF